MANAESCSFRLWDDRQQSGAQYRDEDGASIAVYFQAIGDDGLSQLMIGEQK